MKILIDLTSLDDNFSGIERYSLNISKEMLNLDSKNEYVLLFKNNIHEEFSFCEKKSNVSVMVIKGKNKLIFNQFILPYYLYKAKVDKYIFPAFPSPVLFKRSGIINVIHDLTCWDYPETMKWVSKLYFKISIRNAVRISDRIVTVSKYSKERIMEKFGVENVSIIYNGVSDVFLNYNSNNCSDEVKLKYNLPENYIMCLCTMASRTNLKLLLKAYSELRKEEKISDKLVLVGRRGWKVDDLLKEVNSMYLEDIIITGFVDDIDLPYIYMNANVFIFPSLYEGFGIPVLESMYMGIPVIASDTSSIPEVIGDCGMLFKNNSIEDLKDRIIEYNSLNSMEKLEMSKCGKSRAKKFNWKTEALKLINQLEIR